MRTETIGDATLYLGDCRDVLQDGLAGFDAVVTDPPYGVAYTNDGGGHRRTAPITNDGTRVSLRLYRTVAPFLTKVPCLAFTRWDAWPDIWDIFGARAKINGLLVWDKGTPGMGDLNHWGNSYELIASIGPVILRGGRDSSILRFKPVPSANRNHPTEKPVELFKYLIEKVTDEGVTVLDPFMGAGTTGLAATTCGRKFIGIESEQKYFDLACRRIEAAVSQFKLAV